LAENQDFAGQIKRVEDKTPESALAHGIELPLTRKQSQVDVPDINRLR